MLASVGRNLQRLTAPYKLHAFIEAVGFQCYVEELDDLFD